MVKENADINSVPKTFKDVGNEIDKKVSQNNFLIKCPRCSTEIVFERGTKACPHCGFIFLSTTVDIQ